MASLQNFSQGMSATSGLGVPEVYQHPIYEFYNSQVALQPNPNVHDFQHRFLWSGLGGAGGGGGGHRVDSNTSGNSPAISALGLLAFLFFLNLIQNSLITNRWLLNNTMITSTNITTSTVNGGTTVTSGRKFLEQNWNDILRAVFRPIGKERQKRESDKMKINSTTSNSIPTHPISQFLVNLNEVLWKELPEFPRSRRRRAGHHTKTAVSISRNVTKGKQRIGWIQISNSCIRVLSCKLGRSILLNFGDSSGYLINAMRKYFYVSNDQDSKTTWTSRLMGALVQGSKSKKSCEKLFRNCKWPST